MYLSKIIDREKRVRVSSSREGGERNDSPRKGCQFFSPRKRDCHRRSNLSSTRVTNRSTRRDMIFGSEKFCSSFLWVNRKNGGNILADVKKQ